MSWIPLRVHSFFSFGRGTAPPEALVDRAGRLGFPALALTDRMNLHGAHAFLRAAREAGILPVVGAEVEVRSAPAAAASPADPPALPVLLARNPAGYANLCRLITRGKGGGAGKGGAPRLGPEDLAAAARGLICLDGGPAGLVGRWVLAGDRERARAAAARSREIFGPDFYLELQAGAPEGLNDELAALGAALDLPVVATAPVHHGGPGEGLHALKGPWARRPGAHLRPPAETARAFPDLLEAVLRRAFRASAEIAARCADVLPGPARAVFCSEAEDPALLDRRAREGLAGRLQGLPGPSQGLEDRLAHELAVISGLGLAGYFLILWDLVRWCRGEGIPVGPGRGSAVGSLVCYALGITEVEPVRHGLYFERFLNLERAGPPDVDLDLCSRRRPQALAYLARRHGDDRVAQVGVVATLGARGAVRLAGTLMGLPDDAVAALAGIFPRTRGPGGIAQAIRELPEFARLRPDRPPLGPVLEAAMRLEGMPTHLSAHASGVVVAPRSLENYTPLEPGGSLGTVTQVGAEDHAALGLAKLDCLGLRNLTVIADTVARVAAGGGPKLDPAAIPDDDPQTYRLLRAGETVGCFQLDSPGIRRLLRRAAPERYEDVVAVLSLYRPGPWEAGAVERFVRRRRGKEPVAPLHPSLEPVLAETYGLLLYQEQVMRIGVEVGGLSLAEADGLRRALGKGGGETEAFREAFIAGARSRGLSQDEAAEVFGLLARFSGYSFNKAHTAAYARVTLQTAWLKAHHPVEYFACLLASEGGYFGPDVYLREARRLGIRLLSPDVNRSGITYLPESGAIRAGLLQVPGIGQAAAHRVLRERQTGGPFCSVEDLAGRSRLPKRALAALAEAGALAGLEGAPERRRGGAAPAGDPGESLRAGAPAGPGSPPDMGPDTLSAAELAGIPRGTRVRVGGRMVSAKRRPGSGGGVALTILLEDATGMVEVSVSPAVYRRDLLEINPEGMVVEGRMLSGGPVPRVGGRSIRATAS